MYHNYDIVDSSSGIYEENITHWYYDADCDNLDGYAFSYDVTNVMASNYTKMAVQASANVTNLTIFDGYGLYLQRAIGVNVTPTISLSGADITISPSSF